MAQASTKLVVVCGSISLALPLAVAPALAVSATGTASLPLPAAVPAVSRLSLQETESAAASLNSQH